MAILQRAYEIAVARNTPKFLALADMIWLGFFFLGRPGEYTRPSEDSTPFWACDATLFLPGEIPLSYATYSEDQLSQANFVSMEFTTQKNAVRGERVGHGSNSSPTANPVEAVKRRFQHLRAHNAPPDTALCTYYWNHQPCMVRSRDITAILRQAARELPQYNLLEQDVTARSLRASGAMALLCKEIDPVIIKLLGRWRSDEMLRYLHLQAQPLMRGFAEIMLRGGDYSLLPLPLGVTSPTVPLY